MNISEELDDDENVEEIECEVVDPVEEITFEAESFSAYSIVWYIKGDDGKPKIDLTDNGPEKIGGFFDCSHNKLTSIKGCPKEVEGYFCCSFNQLTSIEGCAEKIGGNFSCSFNKIELTRPVELKCRQFYNNSTVDILDK